MKTVEQYDSYEEMEQDFNNWFGVWLTGWDKEKESRVDIYRNIEAFTDDIVEVMLAITDWQFEEQELKSMNKMNLVYWYCVRLLYLNTDYYYIEDVFDLLDGIRPYSP